MIGEQEIVAIGENAFEEQKTLISITLPDSITSIGNDAFSGCSALTSINIPNGITDLGLNVFKGCEALNYNVYDNASYLGNSENPYLILMKANNKSITTCQINDDTKIVYNNAFSECGALTTVIFGDNVKTVGRRAFNKCSALTSLTFNNGMEKLDESVFVNCVGLTSIVFPESVLYVGNKAFQGCTELTDISIPNGIVYLGDLAFGDKSDKENQIGVCAKLRLNEYDNALYLGNNENPYVVLYKAKDVNITTCDINEKTKIIYDGAFEGCKLNGAMIVPNSVTKINNRAFYSQKISSIKIGSGVLSIGTEAFQLCPSLKTVVIPDNVKKLDSKAFMLCSNIASVTIGDGVESIGVNAFERCTKMTEVTIGSGVKTIGINAFDRCDSLTTAIFLNTSSWTVAGEALTDADLSNSTNAARLISSKYANAIWKCA